MAIKTRKHEKNIILNGKGWGETSGGVRKGTENSRGENKLPKKQKDRGWGDSKKGAKFCWGGSIIGPQG